MPARNGQQDHDMGVPPVNSRLVRSEKVAVRLAREIVRSLADLPRGANLPSEAEMVETYGVSRSSVREALRILEVQGLITIRPGPGGGPVLIGPESSSLGKTETLFFHLLNARYAHLLRGQAALEPMMAKLAARNPDRGQVRELEQFVNSRHEDSTDPGAYQTRAVGFHAAVIAASGNPILTLICQSVRDIVIARIGTQVFSEPADRLDMINDHVGIAQAVLDGDGERAEALMAAHMDTYCTRVFEGKAGLINEIVDWH